MENKDVKVKLGFVPSHRQMFKRSEPWARELRDRALKTLGEAGFLEV